MTDGPNNHPLRVEHALRILPDIDMLVPLQDLLVASSQVPASLPWTALHPYGTLGKRRLQPEDLRGRVQQTIRRVTEHLATLYACALDALDARRLGDLGGVAQALLRAGGSEEQVGRLSEAGQWYASAFVIAEELRERRPEIAALQRIGHLETTLGLLEKASRSFQRSLALSEAEGESDSAARACLGLGDIALIQLLWKGAESWFTRGLGLQAAEQRTRALLTLGLGRAAGGQGQTETAMAQLDRARGMFEAMGNREGVIRSVHAHGLVAALGGRAPEALALYRIALELLHAEGGPPPLETEVRISLCEIHLDMERLPDAEDEVRRGEDLAIAHVLPHQLARLYVIMGKLRARQGDERGFVFFEKALELCRGRQPAPRLEAITCMEYARFLSLFNAREEAAAYLEHARAVFESIEDTHGVRMVETELGAPPPS